MRLLDFEEKVVIITGGASGIGKATAKLFSELGAKVAIADIKAKMAEDFAKTLPKPALAIEMDVTEMKSVKEGVQKIKKELGDVDVLVNSAGWDKLVLFKDSNEKLWEEIIAVNYKGVLNCSKAVLDMMIEKKSGAIVNVASDAGKVGSTAEAVYSGAKAAVIGFTKALAREVARYGIRVNCVCPGITKTPLIEEIAKDEFGAKMINAIIKATPLARAAMPEEIASAIVFFASEMASYITGQALSVSGGLTMG